MGIEILFLRKILLHCLIKLSYTFMNEHLVFLFLPLGFLKGSLRFHLGPSGEQQQQQLHVTVHVSQLSAAKGDGGKEVR